MKHYKSHYSGLFSLLKNVRIPLKQIITLSFVFPKKFGVIIWIGFRHKSVTN